MYTFYYQTYTYSSNKSDLNIYETCIPVGHRTFEISEDLLTTGNWSYKE